MSVAFVQSGGILTVLSTDKYFYLPGEPVRMNLFKLNISPRQITLTYPSTQRFDFMVTGQGGIVWHWSADLVFVPVVQQVVLEPGQALSYGAIWNQLTDSGFRVGPGLYRVTGWNTFVGNERFPRPSALIQILG